jgi:hypothetical protein
MARRTGGAPILARVALIAVAVAACSSAPVESTAPSPPGSESPALSPLPTPPPELPTQPVATEHVEISWELIPDFYPDDVGDIVGGPTGWVSKARCTIGNNSCSGSWFSLDGRSWSRTSIAGDRYISDLAAGATGYVLLARDPTRDERTDDDSIEVWRSNDGQSWTRTGDLDLDELGSGDLCGGPIHLGLAPSGGIVIGDVQCGRHQGWWTGTGPYVSDDGANWKLAGKAALGVDTFWITQVESTPFETLLTGIPCTGCDNRVWSTTDGVTWRDLGSLSDGGPPERTWISALTGNADVTVAVLTSDLWTTDREGPWRRDSTLEGGYIADVTFAGQVFLAAGVRQGSYAFLTSADGTDWMEVADVGLPAAEDDCVQQLGARGDIVLMTVECEHGANQLWRGTIEVVSGPGPTAPPPVAPPPPYHPPTATLRPSDTFDAQVELVDTCLYEPGEARVTFKYTWQGNVPIDSISDGLDGQLEGTSGFPAATSGTSGIGLGVLIGRPYVLNVLFYADYDESVAPGPVIKEIELPFEVNPPDKCKGLYSEGFDPDG